MPTYECKNITCMGYSVIQVACIICIYVFLNWNIIILSLKQISDFIIPLKYLKIYFIALQCSLSRLVIYLLNTLIACAKSSLIDTIAYIKHPTNIRFLWYLCNFFLNLWALILDNMKWFANGVSTGFASNMLNLSKTFFK